MSLAEAVRRKNNSLMRINRILPYLMALEMKSPRKKELRAVLEHEPCKDAEARLRMAFGIILSGISIKHGRKRARKSLTNSHGDIR